MKRLFILLILLSFIGLIPIQTTAQNYPLSRPSSPKEGLRHNKRMIPLDQWEENRQQIHNNLFQRLNTYPVIHKKDFQLDLGPGQFFLRIPIS